VGQIRAEKLRLCKYRKAVDIAKAVPELALNFSTMPAHLAIAKFMAKAAGVLADIRDSKSQHRTN
jgi:hypothetical protein